MPIQLDDILSQHLAPKLKWINIAGYERAGKTEHLVELARHVDSLYCDFDVMGTKPYKGKFLHVGREENQATKTISIVQFFRDIVPNMSQYGKKILILDPVNEMIDMIKDQLISQFMIEDLKDYKVPGKGNGWNILYEKIQSYFAMFFASFDLVITVTHLKLDKYFIGDQTSLLAASMDLVGKTYNYVQRNADVHLVFTSKKEDGKYITLVNNEQSGTLISVPLGSRDYEFLKRIETGDDFVKEIAMMFGVDVKEPHKHEPDEIKF